MDENPSQVVLRAARRAARAADAPLLLAVSGGLDSMALMVAMAEAARTRISAIATFDHGTGPAATAAAEHVRVVARRLGLPLVAACMRPDARTGGGPEATWRRARHDFLRREATARHARIATAHTEDDQIETILMRVLRGAGARGLAGLWAPSPIVRPFLTVRRATLEAYLRSHAVRWMNDPSNDTPAFLRNRVRHDLLPAIRAVAPSFETALLSTGRAAATWRAGVESIVDEVIQPVLDGAGGLSITSAELAGHRPDSLAILCSSLAGRVGLALDRRGTHRLVSFIMREPVRGAIPLSGGWRVEARPETYLLRRSAGQPAGWTTLPEEGVVEWGRFRFRVGRAGTTGDDESQWTGAIPEDLRVGVRSWRAGDHLSPSGGQPRRRVTRYLSEAGIRGSDRTDWPVVVHRTLEEEDVIWVPGVRRSDAATERSGRPVRHYHCERIAP